ncbi:MAG: hypothetical protein RBT76_01635 [candidate division Zixibacteria bacterium]|jgi:hypothetical protein|nr:hypothetical protein [candidate division Zixibacteria bacterium]
MMKKLTYVLVLALLLSAAAQAQETYFGKNKVRYKDFEWSYIQTRHFDIYFYENAYPTAKFAAAVMESSYVEISNALIYRLQRRIPVFVYNSHNDFQQTNIISGLLPEGVAGFTEAFKSRIVLPFNGSYSDFRHTLHHELVHGFQYDMLYGNMFTSLISRQRLFDMPLWFSEGMAEYLSMRGWDYWSDMFMRDATINGYLTPPLYISGYLAYRQGQSMVKYLADRYGDKKIGEILQKGKIYLTMDKAMKASINQDQEEFWKDFEKEMKRRYWPEINKRKEPDEFAKQLTRSGEDGSYFNEKPAFSPDGDKLAIFTDRSDYTEIVLISAIDGEHLKRLVKASRSGDLESLHSYVSGLSFSPDGRSLAFVAKSGGTDGIYLYSLDNDDIYLRKRFDYYNIVGPAWSPDGTKIAFAALDGHKRDLYVWDITADRVTQITDDRFDDSDPTWLPNSNELIFSSDRPHPANPVLNAVGHPQRDEAEGMPGGFVYGSYNLFRVTLETRRVSPVDVGPGPNTVPKVSADGTKLAFISARNGIDNLYVGFLDSGNFFAATNILGGVIHHSWGPEGDRIAMSVFHKGRFDIFVLKDIAPAGENGVLEPTDYVLGKYDKPFERTGETVVSAEDAAPPSDVTTPVTDTAVVSTDSTEAQTPAQLADASEADLPAVGSDTAAADTATTAAATDTTGNDGDGAPRGEFVDDEYVFRSDSMESDPLDTLMKDVTGGSTEYRTAPMEEPASFDSIPPRLPSGEYQIQKYKVKFTPDFVGGGLSYDTFFGLRGQSYFVFSDYLGNHQIYLATDLVNTIDQSNVQLFYFNYRKRINWGIGGFHTKNFYLDNNDFLFSDRFYGLQAYFSRPFSIFSRLQLSLSQYFIDRKYYDEPDPNFGNDRSSKVTTADFSWITDNILWGNTGPVNGRRAKVSVNAGVNLFDSDDVEYYAVEGDYRKYWHFAKTFSMAFRVAFGASEGETPKLYFLGGTTNWIGTRTLDAKVYDVENLYFSDVVTPLRGYDYYELSGNRFGLVNWEFRFPMIQYFIMRYPLPLFLANVNGAVFADVGAAWTDDNFKGGTSTDGPGRLNDIKTGFGFGLRANLWFILLRYDLAWSTDFATVSDRPTSYFSFGADF